MTHSRLIATTQSIVGDNSNTANGTISPETFLKAKDFLMNQSFHQSMDAYYGLPPFCEWEETETRIAKNSDIKIVIKDELHRLTIDVTDTSNGETLSLLKNTNGECQYAASASGYKLTL